MKSSSIFLPGSRWLTYYIYLNPNFYNRFLIDFLEPTVSKAKCANSIPWYFVRYDKPEHHLRIRFDSKEYTYELIQLLEEMLKDLLENNLVFNASINTYKREVYRYGLHSMDLCEKLFCLESQMTLEFLGKNPTDKDTFIFSYELAKYYLNFLVPEEPLRYKVINNQFMSFSQEFNLKSSDYRILNKLYNSNFDNDSAIFNFQDIFYENNSLNSLLEALKTKLQETNQLISTVTSIIHMMINRLINGYQRKHETIVYHHLEQFFSPHKNAV